MGGLRFGCLVLKYAIFRIVKMCEMKLRWLSRVTPKYENADPGRCVVDYKGERGCRI